MTTNRRRTTDEIAEYESSVVCHSSSALPWQRQRWSGSCPHSAPASTPTSAQSPNPAPNCPATPTKSGACKTTCVARRPSICNRPLPITKKLWLDPANPTAHLRLGQIDLAHSRFEPACDHFLAAFKVAPNNRAARQYVGECAALAGETDKAIMLWRSIETGQGQLAVRYAWYNDFLADKPRAERISVVVQALPQ